MSEPYTLILPRINPNGESRKNHIESRVAAHDAVRAAMKVLSELRPHGRDYPSASDSVAFTTALSGYNKRYAMLDRLANELMQEAIVLHQGDKS